MTFYCWLHKLLDKLQGTAGDIDMCCTSKKTVCMIFSPKRRSKTVAYQFPNFTINNEQFSFVNDFKYLGHIISNSQLDDGDVFQERRNVFYRCNMLERCFYSCSVAVKLRLFKSFCLCFYDAALWNNFTAGSLDKFRSAYVKCIKVFFGYTKFYSVSAMLTELNLQTVSWTNVEVISSIRFMHVTVALYNTLYFCI